jgi:hypothetical protein
MSFMQIDASGFGLPLPCDDTDDATSRNPRAEHALLDQQTTMFRKHGDFQIRVDGRIIRSELIGPWNLETAKDYMRRLDAAVSAHMAGSKWGSLVVCRESIQFPLAMIPPLRASIEKRVSQFNQVAVAMVVTPEVEGFRVLYPPIRSIYAGLLPFEIFETVEEAIAWMRPLVSAR